MKLKSFLLIGLFLIPLFSCEDSEVETTEVSAELTVEIPLTSIELKTADAEATYTFTGSGTFSLKDCHEFKNCMHRVEGVNPGTGTRLSLLGIDDVNAVQALQIRWGQQNIGGDFTMFSPIDIIMGTGTADNSLLHVDIGNAVLSLMNNMNTNPSCNFKIEVSGTSNSAIPNLARLDLPMKVEMRKTDSWHFSLF